MWSQKSDPHVRTYWLDTVFLTLTNEKSSGVNGRWHDCVQTRFFLQNWMDVRFQTNFSPITPAHAWCMHVISWSIAAPLSNFSNLARTFRVLRGCLSAPTAVFTSTSADHELTLSWHFGAASFATATTTTASTTSSSGFESTIGSVSTQPTSTPSPRSCPACVLCCYDAHQTQTVRGSSLSLFVFKMTLKPFADLIDVWRELLVCQAIPQSRFPLDPLTFVFILSFFFVVLLWLYWFDIESIDFLFIWKSIWVWSIIWVSDSSVSSFVALRTCFSRVVGSLLSVCCLSCLLSPPPSRFPLHFQSIQVMTNNWEKDRSICICPDFAEWSSLGPGLLILVGLLLLCRIALRSCLLFTHLFVSTTAGHRPTPVEQWW